MCWEILCQHFSSMGLIQGCTAAKEYLRLLLSKALSWYCSNIGPIETLIPSVFACVRPLHLQTLLNLYSVHTLISSMGKATILAEGPPLHLGPGPGAVGRQKPELFIFLDRDPTPPYLNVLSKKNMLRGKEEFAGLAGAV